MAEREDILAVLAPRQEEVEFAGKKVFVRELDCAGDMPAAERALDFSLALIVHCVTDAEGKPIFADEDLQKLRQSARRRIKPLIDAVMRVNGFDVKAEAKNSEGVPASA